MKRTIFTAVVLFLGLLGHTHSQDNVPSADEVIRQVGGVVDLPQLNNLDTSALPNAEETRNLFKEKCAKNGGPDAFDKADQAKTEMEQCLKSLINITELQAEMELHKPNGDLDVVFKKYCNKRSILRACVSNFTGVVEQCLDEKERENKKIVMNITDSMLEFICYKEGDRIALFIAAGGPECFQAKQQAVQDCANRTLSGYIPKTDPSNILGLESLPSLAFGNKECTDMNNLQACMVKELETCPDPTPANIVDSIFNFIKRVTPCENLLNAQSAAATGSGGSGAPRLSSAFTAALVLLSTIASCSRQNYFFGAIA
ncbi:PREDICTED: 27 kDa hemolymph protein-like [Dinoponera quadriceps]|uniref:27 kDa hemolymph protein-like n=1 Tax=Dinoponera quadriceps TaxID=609295 RepID=A0A6P3XB07_DINQU|nr:PREDICTED: 27 kDa hemolymph protein-like [Dinoponera quadriceps]